MQHAFSCLPHTLNAIEQAMSPARFKRFLPAAKGNRLLALRLYLWNSRLCEAFYLPTQLAEVTTRNAIHKPLIKRFSATWYENTGFINVLPPRYQTEIKDVVREQKKARGTLFTADHVIGALSFGFWCNLLTASYEHHLWAVGVIQAFPGSRGLTRQDIWNRVDRLRRFRNKIAHHYAIFDFPLSDELANTGEVIGLVCQHTQWFINEIAHVQRTLSRKPSLGTMHEST